MYPEIDDKDRAMIAERTAAFDKREGYRVGDFVIFADDITRRISHIWPGEGTPDNIQTSVPGASFYLGDGYVDMGSGSLFAPFPADTLTLTDETREGGVWMFHHGHAMAHNGVNFAIPFRVFRSAVEAPEGSPYEKPRRIKTKGHVTQYASMQVTALTPEQHERTCNYWYTVTCGAMAHTAFTTRRGLERWLEERGLTLAGELPEERGEFATMRVIGEYYDVSHGEFSPAEDNPYHMVAGAEWSELEPVVITAAMSNGRYTLALITEEDGIRIVHTLNPNVKTRIEAHWSGMRPLMA